MWTRRNAVLGLACLGGASVTSAIPLVEDMGSAQTPDTRGWSSLLDTLPDRIRAEVRAGTYSGDISQALREAIETGADFVIPTGTYWFAGGALEVRTPGQRIVGTGGILKRLPGRDGIGILVSGANATLQDIRIDGRAPARELSHHNDMVKVTGNRCRIVRLVVEGSAGSNLRVDGAQDCQILHPTLTDAHQNNIVVCNGPARNILIETPICRRTVTQNNIFVTASEGSGDNGEVVSGIVVNNPMCSDAADTGIELGYHCTDSQVNGGKVINSTNPALLQRDGKRNRWRDVAVVSKRLAAQHSTYDSVAVVPQWEPTSWDSDTEFSGIVVRGPVTRSAFYWGQSGIRRIGCSAYALDTTESGGPAPLARLGSGDLKAGGVGNILVRGGRIDGFAIGDNWNFDAARYERTRCITEDVAFSRCTQIFNIYNVTPVRSIIAGNTGTDNAQTALSLVGTQLVPTDARPDTGLVYADNRFAPSSPARPDGDSGPASFLLSRDSRYVRIPAAAAAIVAAPAKAGRYRLVLETGHLDFAVATTAAGPALLARARLASGEGAAVEVMVENGNIVLHQRGRPNRTLWAKITGPGMRADWIG